MALNGQDILRQMPSVSHAFQTLATFMLVDQGLPVEAPKSTCVCPSRSSRSGDQRIAQRLRGCNHFARLAITALCHLVFAPRGDDALANIILLYRLNRGDLAAVYTCNEDDTGTRHNAVDQDGTSDALSETTPVIPIAGIVCSRHTDFVTNHPQQRLCRPQLRPDRSYR